MPMPRPRPPGSGGPWCDRTHWWAAGPRPGSSSHSWTKSGSGSSASSSRSPGPTASGTPPVRHPITGVPCAAASSSARPSPSAPLPSGVVLGSSTAARACVRRLRVSARESGPLASVPSGPSGDPMITSRSPSRAARRAARSSPLSGVCRATQTSPLRPSWLRSGGIESGIGAIVRGHSEPPSRSSSSARNRLTGSQCTWGPTP